MNPLQLVELHDEYRKRCLNLQASENYLSFRARKALSSDMASRYSMVFDGEVHGVKVHNVYGGARYEEEIVNSAESLAKDVFKFKYVNVKPISGHVAAMASLLASVPKHGKIMAIHPQDGGYDGYFSPYLPDMFGLKYVPLKLLNLRKVDTENIRKEKPDVIILGASYILFPYNLREVIEVAEDINAKVIYDASHVMGLLPSGFQEDIEKCHLVYGSTHKSFPGPQGGIIFTNYEEISEKVEKNLTWRVQDNYHTHRIASLAMALYEFRPVASIFGKKVAENTYILARELNDGGLKIRYPPEFSRSHQLLVDENSLKENFGVTPPEMSTILENNGIIVDCVGRIGTAEVTWKGYTPKDMKDIAHAIIAALKGEDVKKEVEDIVNRWDGKTLGEKAEN